MTPRLKKFIRIAWYRSAQIRALFTPTGLLGPCAPDAPPFLFVCGAYNSGTTVIADFITHACGFKGFQTEGDSLAPFLATPESLGYSRYPTSCLAQIDAATQALGPQHARKLQVLWLAAAHPLAGKGMFVEKSISHALRLEWLSTAFPDAKFLWVKRNPYCAIEGMLRRSQANASLRSLPDIDAAAQQWQLISQRIAAFHQKAPHRIREIRYEAFTQDPMSAIRHALSWDSGPAHLLGQSKAETSGKDTENYVFDFHGKQTSIFNGNVQSLTRLTDADIAQINRRVGPDIIAFGYKLM